MSNPKMSLPKNVHITMSTIVVGGDDWSEYEAYGVKGIAGLKLLISGLRSRYGKRHGNSKRNDIDKSVIRSVRRAFKEYKAREYKTYYTVECAYSGYVDDRLTHSEVLNSASYIRNRLRTSKVDTLALKAPGKYLGDAKRLKETYLEQDKKPLSKEKHVGIEIEFYSSYDAADIEERLLDAGLWKYCTLKEDGSLKSSSDDCSCCGCDEHCGMEYCECSCIQDNGHELVLIASERKLPSILKQAIEVLKDVDAYVDKTCGLHVHLDMRGSNAVAEYFRLVRALPLLKRLVPKSRHKNRYAAINETEVLGRQSSSARYFAVNKCSLQKHQTLEVRLHSGTVEYRKILNWTMLLIRITRAPKFNSGYVGILPDVRRKLQLSEPLYNAVKERIQKLEGALDDRDYEDRSAA